MLDDALRQLLAAQLVVMGGTSQQILPLPPCPDPGYRLPVAADPQARPVSPGDRRHDRQIASEHRRHPTGTDCAPLYRGLGATIWRCRIGRRPEKGRSNARPITRRSITSRTRSPSPRGFRKDRSGPSKRLPRGCGLPRRSRKRAGSKRPTTHFHLGGRASARRRTTPKASCALRSVTTSRSSLRGVPLDQSVALLTEAEAKIAARRRQADAA